jgi:hypothetical protein
LCCFCQGKTKATGTTRNNRYAVVEVNHAGHFSDTAKDTQATLEHQAC